MKALFRNYMPWMFVLLCITGACVSPYDDGNKRVEGIVVISGSVNSEQGPYELTLGTTSKFTRITEPISAAEVFLVDSDGLRERYFEFEPGVYICNGSTITGTPGHAYHVEVTLETGERFASRPDTMPSLTGEVILDARNDTANKKIDLFANASIPETESNVFLRWDLTDSYYFEPTDFPDPFNSIPPPCYIDAPMSLQRTILFDGEQNPVREIEDLYITQRTVDYSFKQLHYFRLSLHGLSSNAFIFWKQINQVVEQNGSATDPPPAPVRGNMFNPDDPNEEVLGFFEAFTIMDTSIAVFRPGDFPFPFDPFCEFMADRPWRAQYPVICQNCLNIPFSSYQKPVWWP